MTPAPESLRIVVAGAPRSCQQVRPDGHWLSDTQRARILDAAPGAALVETTKAELAAGVVPEAPDVLLIEVSPPAQYRDEIPAAQLARLVTPRLRWLQSCSSGVGHILGTGLLGPEVLLTNAAGVHAGAIAETAIGGILLHAKRLPERLADQQAHRWRDLHCVELRGQQITILGTGNIGSAVARLAAAFGMHVIGVSRSGSAREGFNSVLAPARLGEALSGADYVVIACPLTPETENMLGGPEFAAMKPGSYLLNVSRGRVVDEDAMFVALKSGRLAGAFLDAHHTEPLPADHAIWDLPGVTVIPHDSHSSPHIGDRIVDLFVDNLRRYLAGDRLSNLVDRARGY